MIKPLFSLARSTLASLSLFLMVSVATHAGEIVSEVVAATSDTEVDTDSKPWIDKSHKYIVTRADSLAGWMDNFFGDVRTEQDAPYSTLRLRWEPEWDEVDKFNSDVKLRGKVYLPQLNERVSLLFSDEDEGSTGHDDLLIDRQDSPEDLSLQYNAKEEERYRIDFRVGLRSTLNLKTSARYKYEYPLQENLLGTFSQEVLYLGGDGLASKTRIDLDKILSEKLILQWHNKVGWEEDVDGVGWNTSVSLDKKLSDKKVFGYFVGAQGKTKPEKYVTTYVAGVRYRQNFYRPWLFFEIQPSYRWFKDLPEDGREGAAVILFRLEAAFQKDFGR